MLPRVARNSCLAFLVVATLMLVALSPITPTRAQDPVAHEQWLLIGFHKSPGMSAGHRAYGGTVDRVVPEIGAIKLRSSDLPDSARQARNDRNVRFVETDYMGATEASFTPNDPFPSYATTITRLD